MSFHIIFALFVLGSTALLWNDLLASVFPPSFNIVIFKTQVHFFLNKILQTLTPKMTDNQRKIIFRMASRMEFK